MTKTKKVVCYVCDEEKPEESMTMIEEHMVCEACVGDIDPDAEPIPEDLTPPVQEPEPQEPPKPPKTPKVKEPKPPKVRKVTCTSVSEELIMAGKTNAEVWEVIKAQFNLDDGKKGYPAWYRMNLTRKGKNPPTFPKTKVAKVDQLINAVQVHCD
jgi:hypothetical protein